MLRFAFDVAAGPQPRMLLTQMVSWKSTPFDAVTVWYSLAGLLRFAWLEAMQEALHDRPYGRSVRPAGTGVRLQHGKSSATNYVPTATGQAGLPMPLGTAGGSAETIDQVGRAAQTQCNSAKSCADEAKTVVFLGSELC